MSIKDFILDLLLGRFPKYDDDEDDEDYEAQHPERYKKNWEIGISDEDAREQ